MNNALEKIKSAYLYFKEKNTSFKAKIPTILTCSRILAPIVVIPLILTGNTIPAIISCGIFASTDFFDGIIARKFKVESEFGSLLDPIVDKIFATTLILCASTINPILLINIIPEIAIAITNSKAYDQNKNVRSSLLGRIKTWILSLNILINLFPGLDTTIKSLSVYFTFAFQSITYIKYKKRNDKSTIFNSIYNECANNFNNQNDNKKEIKTNSKRKQEIELLKYKKQLLENQRTTNEEEKQKILKKL